MKRNLPFFNFGLRWNKSVYVLASSDGVDKYSSCAPCTDLSPRLYRHYSNFPDPDLHSCGTSDPFIAPLGKWHFIPSPLTFICQAAIFVLKLWQSEWHVAPSAPAAPAQNAKRAGVLPGHSPPRASHAVSQASHPPTYVFVRQGQATKCWVIPIKLSGWKRLQMLLFLCLVLSPRSVLFFSPGSCQRWLPGRLVCAFLRSWQNVACEREVEALASATRELLFF